MRPLADELERFYATRRGEAARRLVLQQLRALWPQTRGLTLVGVGYPSPYLAPFLAEGARVVALMPRPQGAVAWPAGRPGRVAVCRDDEIPVPDGSVDLLLLVHALETTRRLDRVLRESWRVLADGGRLVAIVPNRRGLWCLSERTPFGHGQPFSRGQLEKALANHLLTPTATRRCLYAPPIGGRLLAGTARLIERLGPRLAPNFSGLLLVEAEKRVFVGTPLPTHATVRSRRYIPVPESLAAARDEHDQEPTVPA